MRSFKELLVQDVKAAFLNPMEFGEEHTVDGTSMLIIIDENELVQREKKYKTMTEGLHTKQLLIYVSAGEVGEPPLIGRLLELDGEYYVVTDVADEGGIYSISLEANES